MALTERREMEPEQGNKVGSLIGPYRISKLIGAEKGPDGKEIDKRGLYDAQHVYSGQRVFLKSPRPDERDNRFGRDRIRHEWYMYEFLQHPQYVGIARPVELFDNGSTTCLVLPYVGDRTLKDVKASRELTRIGEALVEATKAVKYMHDRGILHRDLKPSNFVLTGPPNYRDRTPVLQLVDLECAKFADRPYPIFDGNFFVSDGFASHAQTENQQVTSADDVFSMGATIFSALMGYPPFQVEGNKGSARSPVSPVTDFNHPRYEDPRVAQELERYGMLGRVVIEALNPFNPERRPPLEALVVATAHFYEQIRLGNFPSETPPIIEAKQYAPAAPGSDPIKT